VSEADAETAAAADGTPATDLNMMMYNKKGASAVSAVNAGAKKPAGDFKPITSYKPTGSLVYNNDLFKKIDERI
jgi:hypothetical protein